MRSIKFLIATVMLLSGCSSYADVQRRVAAKFADPESVKFIGFRVRNGAACGKLNAKNAYAAYTGYRPFFVANTDKAEIALDFGPEYPVPDEKLKILLKADQIACEYQKNTYRVERSACRLEADTRLRNKETNAFIAKFRACEGSDGLAEIGT